MEKVDLFGQRLRDIRERRGYTQDELARRAGVLASRISYYEAGGRQPCIDCCLRLADALEVTVDYLLGRAEEPTGLAAPAQLLRDYEQLTAGDRNAVDVMVRELAKKSGLR